MAGIQLKRLMRRIRYRKCFALLLGIWCLGMCYIIHLMTIDNKSQPGKEGYQQNLVVLPVNVNTTGFLNSIRPLNEVKTIIQDGLEHGTKQTDSMGPISDQETPTKETENCTIPPMNGYPECEKKLQWMKAFWTSDPCYSSYGVDGSFCSFLMYLSEVENWCPVQPGRVFPMQPQDRSESDDGADTDTGPAVVRDSLQGLYQALESKRQFTWIHHRISSMEKIWIAAGHSLSAKNNLTGRKAKQILVHPGLMTEESGFKMANPALSGGPLGELVQWSDLIASLYILGHHVHLSASIPDLKANLGVEGNCPPRYANKSTHLMYTDIVGMRQIMAVLGPLWVKYKCKVRVLDSFGTEPDFNHETWARNHNLSSYWGGLNLIPKQFYNMFPHTPDNTFLGFVVEHQLSPAETQKLQSTSRHKQALVYGKKPEFWKDKRAYLDVIHKHLEIHGTVSGNDASLVPSFVTNHGIVKGTEVQVMLRQSKVFVGLSFPYEGPAPLEALANGCAFLNPRLRPAQSRLNSEFFKDKPNIRELTSQNPYAEAIGEPYVWTVDMDNSIDVERALTAILNQTIEPYLPYEFTGEGMLQRVNVFIEKQDFCHGSVDWPPRSVLRVVMAEPGTSCKQACQTVGLICEPAFFPHLNSAKNLANYGVDCVTSESSGSHLVLPAYTSSHKHCLLQSDPLLFSCVRSHQTLTRVCPCRDYIKDQIALCQGCF